MATQRILFLPDVHVPYEDNRVVALAAEFKKDFRPHTVVAMGDWMSTDQISSFENDCPVDLLDEFARTEALIELLGVTHYLMGNHEERLMRDGLVPANLRKFYDPVRNLHLKERGIQWRPYDSEKGVFKFGKLTALHGFATNQYAARTTADQYGCCVFGHTHRMQTHQPKKARVAQTGFNIGCMCQLRLPYIRTKQPTGWVHGFAFAYLFKSGHFNMYPIRLVGREFIINGKEYRL